MSENINETLGIRNEVDSSSDTKRQPHQTDTHFKTLLGYGKFISGLGWLLVIIGVLLLLSFFLGLTGSIRLANMLSLYALMIGIGFIIPGALMIIVGQSVSCFVAIEKNTRATQELIRAQISISQSAMPQKTKDVQPGDDENDISKDDLFK